MYMFIMPRVEPFKEYSTTMSRALSVLLLPLPFPAASAQVLAFLLVSLLAPPSAALPWGGGVALLPPLRAFVGASTSSPVAPVAGGGGEGKEVQAEMAPLVRALAPVVLVVLVVVAVLTALGMDMLCL